MGDIKIEGTQQLHAQLKALETAVLVKGMRAGVKSGARIVVSSAFDKAPVRLKYLKGGITDEIVTNSPYMVERDVGFGKKQFYGLYQERGTEHMAAHPFLRPAFDENQDKIIAAMVIELKAAVEAVTI